MGDYNINLLHFGTHQKTNEFLDDVISQGFVPNITKPTRITPISATLIDHIYSNHTYANFNSGIIITDVADHFGIFHVVYQDKVKTHHHPRHIQIRYTTLKKKSSTGFDNISTNIIRKTINEISTPLAHIINQSFITGTVPDKLKIAKIVPIFK